MRETEPGVSTRSKSGWPLGLDLVAGLVAALALALSLRAWLETSPGWVTGAAAVYLVLAAMVYGAWNAGRIRGDFGWANRVTLARAVLVAVLAGVFAAPELVRQHGVVVASLAFAAIALDGLDGWLARKLERTTRFGARFDMEIDALLILVLSIAVLLAERAGAWVLAIGGMRYVFVLAGQLMPWLQDDLPASTWRRIVCVVQGLALSAALLPWLSEPLVKSALALSLAALAHSFGRDTLWLWRHRETAHR